MAPVFLPALVEQEQLGLFGQPRAVLGGEVLQEPLDADPPQPRPEAAAARTLVGLDAVVVAVRHDDHHRHLSVRVRLQPAEVGHGARQVGRVEVPVVGDLHEGLLTVLPIRIVFVSRTSPPSALLKLST